MGLRGTMIKRRLLRLLVRLKRLPRIPRFLVWLLLVWPLLIPILTLFPILPLLLGATVIAATVLSVLKYNGLLLELHPSWFGIIVASTIFFWYPVVIGYIVFAGAGVIRWCRRPGQGRRGSDIEAGVAETPARLPVNPHIDDHA